MKKFNRIFTNYTRRSYSSSSPKVGILDVPFEKGQDKSGVEFGPKSIRDAGLLQKLIECCGITDLKDYGEVKYLNNCRNAEVLNMKHYDHVISCSKELSEQVEKVIRDGRICLTLGGDHSIGIGTIHGHMRAKSEDLAVLWVDAHADLNTNRSSHSGNIHGADWLQCKLSLRNLAYIGLRSIDPYEHVIMHNLGISHFDMFDIQRYGIDTVVSAAIDQIDPDHNKPIHVSFDIDSLDPLEAPSTGTPVRGGLLLREGIHIMTAIYKTGRLGALDLVEVNPKIGTQGDVERTVTAALHIILAAFGENRRLIKLESNNLIPPTNNK
ncbi:Arginase family [Popillia japonica]|uniref:Arginase n=1 Tax=Popillia japonica TaxID=7064 RepID=A0AAW1KNQ5_POPJA